MSHERKYIEREVRKRERNAFYCGAWWQAGRDDSGLLVRDHIETEARRRYPITRKVPRRITLPLSEVVAHVDKDGDIRFMEDIDVIKGEDIAALADLIANRFEEVVE